MYLKCIKSMENLKQNFICIYYYIYIEIKILNDPILPPHFSTCPARSVGLREPPPVWELSMLCTLIKREQSHWGRPLMTHNSGMVCKKINYRLNRSKINNVRVSKFYDLVLRSLNLQHTFESLFTKYFLTINEMIGLQSY